MKRIVGIIAAVAAVTLSAAACQSGGTTTATGGSPSGTPGHSAVSSTVAAPPGTGSGNGNSGNGSGNGSGGSPDAQQPPAPATAGNGACVDLNSPVVTAALNSLGPGVGGDGYVADSGTDAAVGSCPDMLWVLAATPRGTASSPWHVLFFNHAGYLGTATKNNTSYTSVVGSSARAVQVKYRWLAGSDASCCPSGGPVVVTYTLGADGHTVTPDRDIPREVTDPNPAGPPPVCPVSKSVLVAALRGTEIETRLAKPVELDDRIDCAGEWAMAVSGSHGGTTQAARVLFHYVAVDGGWQPVSLGSAIPCAEKGVPKDVADKICH